MPIFPGIAMRGTVFESGGGNAADSGGVTMTTDVAANTKGAYAEIIASTDYHSSYLIVSFANASVAGDALVDIAIGAAASETVILENLYNYNRAGQSPHSYLLPVNIPAGTRVAACFQHTTGGTTMDIAITLIGGDFLSGSFNYPLTYGANTGNSGGTNIDPGGTINTLGAYTQITASLTRDVNGLILVIDNNADNARTACQWLLNFARGGAGAEQILQQFLVGCDGTADLVLPACFYLPIFIPAGERLSAACQCSINTAGDRLLGVLVIAW